MHSEPEVVWSAIKALRDSGGILDTGDLITNVKNSLHLDVEDLEHLQSEDIPRINRIIRNLKSHKTLLNMGLVEHYDGGFMLTEYGEDIKTDELDRLVEEYFAPMTNDLTVQTAMVKYVDEIACITFKNRREAAALIRKGTDTLPEFKNDVERLDAVADVIMDYVSNHPQNVITVN